MTGEEELEEENKRLRAVVRAQASEIGDLREELRKTKSDALWEREYYRDEARKHYNPHGYQMG